VRLFVFQELGDALDQLGLLHLVGNFGDDDLPGAAASLFLLPARAHPEGTAAGLVGFRHRCRVFHQNAASWEVRPPHMLEQRPVLHIGIFD
jgi:hypothetical protein